MSEHRPDYNRKNFAVRSSLVLRFVPLALFFRTVVLVVVLVEPEAILEVAVVDKPAHAEQGLRLAPLCPQPSQLRQALRRPSNPFLLVVVVLVEAAVAVAMAADAVVLLPLP